MLTTNPTTCRTTLSTSANAANGANTCSHSHPLTVLTSVSIHPAPLSTLAVPPSATAAAAALLQSSDSPWSAGKR